MFAGEFIQIPARRSDDEPLAKLVAQLRTELDTKVSRRERDSSWRHLIHHLSTGPKVPETSSRVQEGGCAFGCAGAPKLKVSALSHRCSFCVSFPHQMNRRSLSVPDALIPDMEQVLALLPLLLEELLKMAMRPRPPHGTSNILSCGEMVATEKTRPIGYMWLRPALSVLEYSQNLTQALPISCVPNGRVTLPYALPSETRFNIEAAVAQVAQ
jgi:translocation protein SEC63